MIHTESARCAVRCGMPDAETGKQRKTEMKEIMLDIIWLAVGIYAIATIREKGGAEWT